MYLSAVSVRNFRNLKNFAATFSPGLNVIVGENNVGKTNLLDAIRAALGSASATGEPLRLDPDDLYVDEMGNRTNEPIQVDLIFSNLTEAERAHCLEILNYEASDPTKSSASIHFEWAWSDNSKRWTMRRWAGNRPVAEAAVPDEILQAIPLTLLIPMRDALRELTPGRQSRLGRVLAASAGAKDREDLEAVVRESNLQLQKAQLINTVESRIEKILSAASGPALAQHAAIRTSEPKFDRIVNSLRLVLKLMKSPDKPEEISLRELQMNGLGYNNVLYIATVLTELEITESALLPLLFVEEPEAHLHPQLQTLLADYLAESRITKHPIQAIEAEVPSTEPPARTQTIVTTHSPTIAAHVSPMAIRVMHSGKNNNLRCTGLADCGLTIRESNQLRRLLDVTKATLLFAKGVVLVEGVTEAMLLPVFARRLGKPLEHKAISVVPVHGVDFATLAKMFGESKLLLPLAIVTDGDPAVIDSTLHGGEVPAGFPDQIVPCERAEKLLQIHNSTELIKVFTSTVTFEYDLALAGEKNAQCMCTVWESLYDQSPGTFNSKLLAQCGGDKSKNALLVWRGVCRSYATRSKAEFAQTLANALDTKQDGVFLIPPEEFVIPEYISAAISHVMQ